MSTSPINAAKNMQGFVSASQRQRCATCQHANTFGQDRMQCRKGGFMVTAYAVCLKWHVAQPPGFKGGV